MAKMMTYLEANAILESSLTPNGRCICKKTAIDNHAVASRLSAFVNNRLVPASMVVLITYYIQFKDWDGTVLSTQTVKYGHKPTKPANPTRTGYTFTGWSNNPDSTPTGDTVYTAQYQINSYTIRFLDYDGTVLKTQSVNHGSTPTPPSNPTRTGHSFIGWSPSITAATQNRDYTAQYIINDFTVTFLDGDGGVFSTQTVSYGGYASAPNSNPTKTGCTFKEWSPNPSSTPITSNTTFSPTWNSINYTVTFKIRRPGETSYGILSTKSDYHYGDTIIVPTVPQFNGYVFSGWQVYVPTTVTGDLETFGWYEPDTTTIFTMTWYYNGGTDQYGDTVEYKTSPKQYGSSFESDVYKLVWNGAGNKTFDGWEGAPADGTPVYQDYTMHAKWKDATGSTFTVEYILWTQTSPNPTREQYAIFYNVPYGSSVPTPSTTPSLEGYRFDGWSWNGSAIPSTVTRDLTITGSLVPRTEPLTYLVRFVVPAAYNNSGRDIYDGTYYEMGDTITCPTNYYTSETDATFLGWDVNGTLKQPGDTITCTGTADYYASYSTSGGGGGGQITITFVDNLNHNSSSSITKSLSNGSYTLQSGDFPTWSSSITHNRYAYTAHSPFWDYSAGDTLTSNTTITGTYDPVVNNSRFYYYYEASLFGGLVLYSGNVENGQDPETTLGADAWANNHNHGGYTFTGWSGPTETSHPGSSGQSPWTSYDYVATYERTETEKTVSFYLEYRDVNTPAQAISGSISAHAGGWGASGSLTPGNGCTFSCSNSADWAYDVYGSGEINGESITFSDMPWNSSMTFYVEDYITSGGGGTGGDDPNEHNTDTPNEPSGNTGGTTDDGGGGSNLEGGEQQGSGGAGQGNSGNQGGQETYEEDPNVNPGGNEGGDTGGGNNNEGGNTGGNTGPDTEDHDQEELEP